MSDYDAAWRRVRARVLRDAQFCWICGLPLDFEAPARSRWSPSVDHILSLRSMRGVIDPELRDQLRLDPAGLRPVHLGCNSRRGDGRHDRPQHTSREWR